MLETLMEFSKLVPEAYTAERSVSMPQTIYAEEFKTYKWALGLKPSGVTTRGLLADVCPMDSAVLVEVLISTARE